MNVDQLILYFIALLGLALFPGPTVSMVAAAAANGRDSTAYGIIAGITVANLVSIFLSGIARYVGFALPGYLAIILPILGSISLILIGLRIFLNSLSADVKSAANFDASSIASAFTRGLAVHISNPNTFVFFFSIFLSIVPLDDAYIRNVILLGAIAVVVDIIVLWNYSMLSRTVAESLLSETSILRRTPLISAIVLIVLGLKGIVTKIPSLFN